MRADHKPVWQIFVAAADKAQQLGDHALAVEFLETALDMVAAAHEARERREALASAA